MRHRPVNACGIALLQAVCAGAALAASAPVIIHDSGQTRPLAPYYSALAPEEADRPDHPADPEPGRRAPGAYLPLRTQLMSPGRVARKTRAEMSVMGLPAVPVFVIGADKTSLRWLSANRDQLVALGAVGLLVQAETVADLQAVARAGTGLRITPVPGDEIARQLDLTHYPVLISGEGIEQ